ncbi:hypothetical protein AB4089_12260 [Arthrobacter sp. 2MCAF15]|uniref:hypothetical protein n=1 Tax=Arthrobacter sp. 2MCAF15 TaxID=3232984 RepID=UPI003F8F2E25
MTAQTDIRTSFSPYSPYSLAAGAALAPAGSGALLAVIALEMTTALLAATLLARLRAQPSS